MKTFELTVALLSLSAGFAACAQSSVSLYGLVDAGPLRYKLSGAGFGGSSTRTTVDGGNMTTSYLGFRGSEDLGSGLKAVFTLEAYFRPDIGEIGRFGAADTTFKRNSFVGLDDARFGRVILGRTGLPLFTTVAAFNPFAASFRFSPLVMNLYGTDLTGSGINSSRAASIVNDSAWSNVIAYSTPSMGGGFQGNALYSFGSGSNQAETSDRQGKAWSIGGTYLPKEPLSASFSYQKVSNIASGAASAIDNQQSWLGGLAYDFSVIKLFGNYGQIKTVVAAVGADKDKVWQLGASVPFGAGRFMASYSAVKVSAEGGAATVPHRDRKSWAVGYNYQLSRRTDVYIAYADYRLDATVAGARGEKIETITGVGIRHSF